jgi:hypothetical protein
VHINAHRAGFVLGVLIVVQSGELRGTAQGLPSVRVIPAEAKVFVRPEVISDVVAITRAGTVLDLIDRREGWYWILTGRDQNGSRQSGWIQADQVAIATAPSSRDSLRTVHEELGALPKAAEPPLPRADAPMTEEAQARKAAREARKAERALARKAAGEARAAARLDEAGRIDSRKAEREQARKAAEEARAAARLDEAARNVEEARRKLEGLTKKPE